MKERVFPQCMHIGQKKGMLTLLEYAGRLGRHRAGTFQCDCGRTAIIRLTGVNRGTPYSCGCKVGVHRKLPPGEAVFNALFRSYMKGAEKRGYEFALSKEQFKKFTSMNCHYCGSPPATRHKKHRTIGGVRSHYNGCYTSNGIDRIDNSRGYVIDNCVPCCRYCNTSKSVQTYDEYIQRCSRVADKFRQKVKISDEDSRVQ